MKSMVSSYLKFFHAIITSQQCLDAEKYPGTGSYILQFADDFTYTDPVSFNIIHVYSLCLVVTSSNWNLNCPFSTVTHLILLARSMGVSCQSKVFGLFSLMDQGSFIVYQYVSTSLCLTNNLGDTSFKWKQLLHIYRELVQQVPLLEFT